VADRRLHTSPLLVITDALLIDRGQAQSRPSSIITRLECTSNPSDRVMAEPAILVATAIDALGKSDQILTAADGTILAGFVAGLRDAKAIRAALELPWIRSPLRGQISRFKMLKRTMYGRARLDLRRARVLHAG
jgi:hypothetical protein